MSVRPLLERRFPWLAPELEQTAANVFARSWDLDVPIERAWRVLSDTSRLNRALRIPVARFDEHEGARTGESRYFGRAFTWSEPPWEWVAPQVLVCRKSFERGPVAGMLAVISLEPTGSDGCRCDFWYGWIPRGMLGGIAARRLTGYITRAFEDLMPRLIESLEQGAPDPLKRVSSTRVPGATERADRIRAVLIEQGADPTVVDGLVEHVLHGDPLELDRLRPFALADRWRQDREEVLALLLAASRQGLLLARWDVLCPHCRGVRQTLERLDDLANDARCEACDLLFETGSSALELAFRVHPSIRHVERRMYCAADAAMKPHIRMQVLPTEARSVPAPLAEGTYLLRHRAERHRLQVEAGAPSEATVEEHARIGPGGVLHLPASQDRWTLEQVVELADAVQPRHVFSLDAYRAVMGSERLGADLALELGVQTLLFTDVVGSTALYQRVGDRAAFAAIRAHFAILAALIASEGGAIVKTIGDAVMAAFTTPEAAARAARAIATTDLHGIQVRLSMHAGPCLAVNLDAGVDYFGAVVNEAAKLQHAAGASEVALTPELAATLGLTGRSATYRSGPDERSAVVWMPPRQSPTPPGIARRGVASS